MCTRAHIIFFRFYTLLLVLVHLFDKASDAEYCTKKANEEEILCWVNFGKEFMVHFSELMENSNGKIGEKKAKGIIYDEMLEHLATIREKRSKEMGTQLPKISRSSLTRRTQRSMKLVRIFEKIGIDKIKYLSAYSPNSISELANDQIQEIIEASERRNNSTKQDDFPTPEISAGNLETSEKILPEVNVSTTPKPAGVSVPTAPIPSNHDSAGSEAMKSLAIGLGTKSN